MRNTKKTINVLSWRQLRRLQRRPRRHHQPSWYERRQRLRTQIMNYLRFDQMYSLRWLKVLAAPPPPLPYIRNRNRSSNSSSSNKSTNNDKTNNNNLFIEIIHPLFWVQCSYDQPSNQSTLTRTTAIIKLIGFLCLPTKPIPMAMKWYDGLCWHALGVQWACAPSPPKVNKFTFNFNYPDVFFRNF